MARRKKAVAPQHEIGVLSEIVNDQGNAIKKIRQPGPTSFQPDNWEEAVDPAPYENMVHWPGGHRPAYTFSTLVYYHPGYIDPDTGEEVEAGWKYVAGPAVFAIKVYADTKAAKVGDMRFGFTIPQDLNKTKLRWAQGFVTTVSSQTTVQVRNVTRGFDMLTEPIRIPAGEYDSTEHAVQPEPDIGGPPANPRNKVFTANLIAIDVDAAGALSKGLGVYLAFQ